jgi:hypothetical protein
VLHRAPDGSGFDVDASRVAYLRYLRRERRQSPHSEADADLPRAESELIRLRIAEKQRHLIPLDEAISQMDELVGLFLTHLSGLSAQCGGRDLAVRRAIDKAVFEMRVEISEAATMLADQRGEPPLGDDRCRDDRCRSRGSDRALRLLHEQLLAAITATVVDPASLCADAQRAGFSGSQRR